MKLLNTLMSKYLKWRMPSIEYFIENPFDVQELNFFTLLHEAKNTAWGKEYDYKSIKSYQDFANRIPIQDYESLRPYIERMMKGEGNVLWSSPIKWYAKSSGTTNTKSKYIPVSKDAMDGCHYKASRDFMAIYFDNNPESTLFTGKGLVLGGSNKVHQSGKVYTGDLSAVLMQNMPRMAQYFSTPSLEVLLMDNWEKKLKAIIDETLNENVTSISGVPTWTLVLIKEIFEQTGKSDLSEVWQNLELYIHGGVSFTPYREQFKSLIKGNNVIYKETYNASEGFFSIQYGNQDDDMLLMLDYGIFYEFIEATEVHNDNPKVITLENVEMGKNYAIIISTNSGLWRYMIGDTIEFTSINPYKIKVTGRTKHYINAFGEELIIDNADKAIAKTCTKLNCSIIDYTAAPVYLTGKEKGKHQWLIEFENPPQNIPEFSTTLDKEICQLNSDYEAKRAGSIALEGLEVVILPKHTFSSWLKQKQKLGGQHKVPRLSNNRNYVEDILRFINV